MESNKRMNKQLQKHQISRMLENVDIEPDLVDLEHEIDGAVGLASNIDTVETLIGRSLTQPDHKNGLDMAEDYHQKILDLRGPTREGMLINDRLLDLIPEFGIVVVLGDIQGGKSVLGYGLLEEMGRKLGKKTYVHGLPLDREHLLPPHIEPWHEIVPPNNSIVLYDEAYRDLYARNSQSKVNKFADTYAGLLGQKRTLAIYVTQMARKIELGIRGSPRVVLWKVPYFLTPYFESPGIRKMARGVLEAFEDLSEEEAKRSTYVHSPKFQGIIKKSNTPPSWWTEDLSTAFSDVDIIGEATKPTENTKVLQLFMSEDPTLQGFEIETEEGRYGYKYIASFTLVEDSGGYVCSQGSRRIPDIMGIVAKLREKGIDCVIETKADLETIK